MLGRRLDIQKGILDIVLYDVRIGPKFGSKEVDQPVSLPHKQFGPKRLFAAVDMTIARLMLRGGSKKNEVRTPDDVFDQKLRFIGMDMFGHFYADRKIALPLDGVADVNRYDLRRKIDRRTVMFLNADDPVNPAVSRRLKPSARSRSKVNDRFHGGHAHNLRQVSDRAPLVEPELRLQLISVERRQMALCDLNQFFVPGINHKQDIDEKNELIDAAGRLQLAEMSDGGF